MTCKAGIATIGTAYEIENPVERKIELLEMEIAECEAEYARARARKEEIEKPIMVHKGGAHE